MLEGASLASTGAWLACAMTNVVPTEEIASAPTTSLPIVLERKAAPLVALSAVVVAVAVVAAPLAARPAAPLALLARVVATTAAPTVSPSRPSSR